jgi:hypothetical protein
MAIAFFAAGTAYEPAAGAASPHPHTRKRARRRFYACLIMPNLTTTLSPPAGEGWTVVPGSPNAAPSALREFAWYKFADASEAT